MALSKVNITLLKGGLAREAAGEDHISGIITYNTVVPGTGITELGGIKKYGSYQDAEADGITQSSSNSIEWYNIKQFFLQNPNGVCYLMIASTGATYDFTEINDIQNYASGTIRQVAVIMPIGYAFDTDDITVIQAIATANQSAYQPLQVLYSPSFTGVTTSSDVDGLTDLKDGTYDAPDLSIIIGTDGDGVGSTLTGATMAGASLGVLSKMKVSDSIAWVGQNNLLSLTSDFDNPKIGGIFISGLTSTQLDTLHDSGYIFVRKFVNKAGAYISGAPTVTDVDDDFTDIQTRRTINKVYRGVYVNLVDLLNSPLLIDAETGYMDFTTVKIFEDEAGKIIAQMKRNDEISDGLAYVNPSQNVLSTSIVNVSVTIVPKGTAKQIQVDLGLATTL
jgi:Protein of unknown function (DUF2586)